MPTYVYKCKACRMTFEMNHSMDEIDNPTENTLNATTCPYDGDCIDFWKDNLKIELPEYKELRFERIPQMIQIKGSYGGSIPQGSEKRSVIQKERMARSHNDFKKNIFPTIPKAEKKFFKEKWKKTGRE